VAERVNLVAALERRRHDAVVTWVRAAVVNQVLGREALGVRLDWSAAVHLCLRARTRREGNASDSLQTARTDTRAGKLTLSSMPSTVSTLVKWESPM
jgi:hypothetical protein